VQYPTIRQQHVTRGHPPETASRGATRLGGIFLFGEVATKRKPKQRDDDEEFEEDEPVARTEEVWEHFKLGDAFREARVDRDQRMITNVTLGGRVSKNGRTYSEQALNDAVRLFAHAPFYLDHPTEAEMRERKGVRSVLDLAGEVVNPRRAGDQVRGDLHVLEREPTASLVFALAEQMPHMAGNSLRARGTIRPGVNGASDVVEGLAEVFGVELVTDPATTAGLFESVNQGDDMDFKTLTAADIKKHRPELIEALLKETPSAAEAAALARENKALKEQIADRDATQAERDRAVLITQKLAEAKLPDVLVTEQFKTQLKEAANPAAVSALIAERKAIAGKVKFGRSTPRSTEVNLDERRPSVEADGTRPIDEEKIDDYARMLGLKLVAS
jgi:hypothetical protein